MNNIISLLIFFVATNLIADSNIEKYNVKYKDYLIKIAEKCYGDKNKWVLIYNANRDKIDNPDLIYPDMVLEIPMIKETKNIEEELNIKQGKVDVIDKPVEKLDKTAEKQSISISSNSLKENKTIKKTEYSIIDKSILSNDFPDSMTGFNVNSIRIAANKEYFDGVVEDIGENKFALKGDVIKISAKKKQDVYKNAYIYSIYKETDEAYIVDRVGQCIIVENNISCVITDATYPITKNMLIKLWN